MTSRAAETLTDAEIIFTYLLHRPGWNDGIQMSRTLKPGAVSWAYRSRISECNSRFRKKGEGWIIESRIGKDKSAQYKLRSVPARGSVCRGEGRGGGVWV